MRPVQGLIERESAYDPRDLFSGDPPRMAAALRALLADPQNNLRLFWRGERVPPAPGGLAAAAGTLPAVQALGGLDGLVDVLVAVLHAERAPLLPPCGREGEGGNSANCLRFMRACMWRRLVGHAGSCSARHAHALPVPIIMLSASGHGYWEEGSVIALHPGHQPREQGSAFAMRAPSHWDKCQRHMQGLRIPYKS